MIARSSPPSPLVLYAFVFLLFLLLFFGPFWYYADGATFHLQNFLLGEVNNASDLSRIVAILLTDGLDLLYVRFGGKNFSVSQKLFTFGQTFHIFWPLFFLWWVGHKGPEKKDWACRSLWFYCFSLFCLRGLGLSFLVSELNVTHTVTWLAILSFQAGSEFRRMHWTLTTLSLFCYPSSFLVNASFFLHEVIKKRKTAYYYGALAIGAFVLSDIYTGDQFGTGNYFYRSLREFRENYTVHFYLASLMILAVKEFFPGQRVVLIVAGFLLYIVLHGFRNWHTYHGRIFGMALMTSIQFAFIMIPPVKQKEIFGFIWPRIMSFLVLALAMITFHVARSDIFRSRLEKLLDKEQRSFSFEDAKRRLYPYNYLNRLNVRMITISLELLKGPHIGAAINPAVPHGLDLICVLGEEKFRELLKEKNITVGPQVKFEDCGSWR